MAKKKTYPALFGLFRNGFLPEKTHIIGYARTKMTNEDYLSRVTQYIKTKDDETKKLLDRFKQITSYQAGLYDDDDSWKALASCVSQSEQQRQIGTGQKHRVFYMALPPSVFVPVTKGLKKNVYSSEGINRLVVEKPFGKDTQSSNELGREIGALFKENEVLCVFCFLCVIIRIHKKDLNG